MGLLTSDLQHFLQKVGSTLDQALMATSLDWSFKKLDAIDAKAVAFVLSLNGMLKELHLYHNSIGDAGAAAIAEALRVNDALTKLGLYKNSIGDAGAAAIADALKVNGALTFINLA